MILNLNTADLSAIKVSGDYLEIVEASVIRKQIRLYLGLSEFEDVVLAPPVTRDIQIFDSKTNKYFISHTGSRFMFVPYVVTSRNMNGLIFFF